MVSRLLCYTVSKSWPLTVKYFWANMSGLQKCIDLIISFLMYLSARIRLSENTHTEITGRTYGNGISVFCWRCPRQSLGMLAGPMLAKPQDLHFAMRQSLRLYAVQWSPYMGTSRQAAIRVTQFAKAIEYVSGQWWGAFFQGHDSLSSGKETVVSTSANKDH